MESSSAEISVLMTPFLNLLEKSDAILNKLTFSLRPSRAIFHPNQVPFAFDCGIEVNR